jgi:hypothetical protein
MKKYNLRTAIPAQPALPALSGTDCAGIADTADIAARRCKTEREVLDAVRLVFPNAKYVRREPPLDPRRQGMSRLWKGLLRQV